MVNNNGIPIEVKKPFETVYELKNEIPSYEEFMKTYESDGKLNYDDLSDGNVSEVKGYGPCLSGNMSNYNCSREELQKQLLRLQTQREKEKLKSERLQREREIRERLSRREELVWLAIGGKLSNSVINVTMATGNIIRKFFE